MRYCAYQIVFVICFSHWHLLSQKYDITYSIGKIDRIENFPSKYVTSRNIDVWLPENYRSNKEYAVLYMHDGQMLFDPSNTWNKQSWEIDSVASALFHKKEIKEFIVIGIWNDGIHRHQDYFPNKTFSMLPKDDQTSLKSQLNDTSFHPNGDNYLRFIVQELKPFIEVKYSVSKKSNDNYIAGSSMGGLISIYALCEYPKEFGGAACLSTHWTGSYTTENNSFPFYMEKYLFKKIKKLKSKRIYFDCGDQELDALYPSIQNKIDEIFNNSKFKHVKFLSKYFPNEGHNENAWKKRVHFPLTFLFSY